MANTKKKSETPETPETAAIAPALDERDRVAAEIKAQMASLAERYDFDVPSKAKEEYGEVQIEELHNIEGLDSRAGMTPLDKAFVQSLKKDDGSPHLIEPVVATWAKDKQTGKIIRLLVAGRRRVAGFTENGFKTIKCITRPSTLKDVLIDAGIENLDRKGMTGWDLAVYFERLKAAGLNQSEIATRRGVSNATVSQTLSLLTLDPRVQTLMKKGKFGAGAVTIGRELAKIEDLDKQHEVALQVIADPNHIWSASDVQEFVKQMNDRAAAAAKKKAEKEKAKKKAAKEAKERGEDAEGEEESEEEEEEGPAFAYDRDAFQPIEKPALHYLLEGVNSTAIKLKEKVPDIVTRAKALKDEDAELFKYVALQGQIKGLEEAAGLAKLPKSVLTAVEAEATEE